MRGACGALDIDASRMWRHELLRGFCKERRHWMRAGPARQRAITVSRHHVGVSGLLWADLRRFRVPWEVRFYTRASCTK